ASVSVDAEASAVTESGAPPEAGASVKAATGAASTVTVLLAVDDRLPVSVTVTVTVRVPPDIYVWVAFDALWGPTVVPSPKLNEYVEIGVLSVSVDAVASAVTASGATPEDGVTVRAATGGVFGGGWNS